MKAKESIAESVILKTEGARATTYTGGYAIMEDSTRILFPPAQVKKERRNEKERVTYGLYEFPDQSQIEFRSGRGVKAIL